jgi:hypothetical protein
MSWGWDHARRCTPAAAQLGPLPAKAVPLPLHSEADLNEPRASPILSFAALVLLDFEDHGMVADGQRNEADISEDLGWCSAQVRVLNLHVRIGVTQINRDLICAGNLLAPNRQLEDAATFLKQQIVDGEWALAIE